MQVSATRLRTREKIEHLVGTRGLAVSYVYFREHGIENGQTITHRTLSRDARRHVLVHKDSLEPDDTSAYLLFLVSFPWYRDSCRLMGRKSHPELQEPKVPRPVPVFCLLSSPHDRSLSHTPYGQPTTPPRLLGSPGTMWKPLERLIS